MAVIGIDYEETKPETYNGIYIHYEGGRKEFNTGNFIKDWYAHQKWIVNEIGDGELKDEHHFSNSSSVDHFIMDGANVISRYLKYDEKTETPYLTKEYDWHDAGTEVFIPEGTDWNWNEYKKYCNE
jgi:hypothetical protein